MIVNTGKRIRIETGIGNGNYVLHKDCDTPGRVTVEHRDGRKIDLPGNPEEAERFATAYLRAVTEDVGYRKYEVE